MAPIPVANQLQNYMEGSAKNGQMNSMGNSVAAQPQSHLQGTAAGDADMGFYRSLDSEEEYTISLPYLPVCIFLVSHFIVPSHILTPGIY